MKKRYLPFMLIAALLTGCATVNPPSPMLETDVYKKLIGVKAEKPKEKIYRQYVSGRSYSHHETVVNS
ncbi:hypothetical protein CWI84_01935 [Idiomarina tyrosinivorans]|uniref:Uncharacterized protein n=1 Tax=Idiomarina tyrosinivorans TaxID=1445662 RepID=A0A432ZUE4_9GAMM|nr:hypothetical protein [Idiomarina tyrosinivorans]RUO81540.1 hypothetical protein CWI84_01935 [Idiomarina tyrosinivorans]